MSEPEFFKLRGEHSSCKHGLLVLFLFLEQKKTKLELDRTTEHNIRLVKLFLWHVYKLFFNHINLSVLVFVAGIEMFLNNRVFKRQP